MMWSKQLHHVLVHKLKSESDQHCCPWDHTQTITWSRILVYRSYIKRIETNEKSRRSHYFKWKQTSPPQQNWQKLYPLIEKSFDKTAQKTACILIKLAHKTVTRNSKENPATLRKKQPDCAGQPPNWQHCWSDMQLQW